MEENMTNEMIDNVDTIEEVELEVYEEPEEEGVNWAAVAVIGGLATLSGIAIAKRKKIKDWWTRRQVNKLEKQGFVIWAPGQEIDNEDECQKTEVYESDEE